MKARYSEMAEKAGTRRITGAEIQRIFPGMEVKSGGGDMVVLSKMCRDGRRVKVEMTDLWHFYNAFSYRNPGQPYFDVKGAVTRATGIDFNCLAVKVLFGWAEEETEGETKTLKLTLTTPTMATEVFVIAEYDTRPDKYLEEYMGMDVSKLSGWTKEDAGLLSWSSTVKDFMKVPDEDSGVDGYEHGYDFWILSVNCDFLEDFRKRLEAEDEERKLISEEWVTRFCNARETVKKRMSAALKNCDLNALPVPCEVRKHLNYLVVELGQIYFVFPYENQYLFALTMFLQKLRCERWVPEIPEGEAQGMIQVEMLKTDVTEVHWYREAALKGVIIF